MKVLAIVSMALALFPGIDAKHHVHSGDQRKQPEKGTRGRGSKSHEEARRNDFYEELDARDVPLDVYEGRYGGSYEEEPRNDSYEQPRYDSYEEEGRRKSKKLRGRHGETSGGSDINVHEGRYGSYEEARPRNDSYEEPRYHDSNEEEPRYYDSSVVEEERSWHEKEEPRYYNPLLKPGNEPCEEDAECRSGCCFEYQCSEYWLSHVCDPFPTAPPTATLKEAFERCNDHAECDSNCCDKTHMWDSHTECQAYRWLCYIN